MSARRQADAKTVADWEFWYQEECCAEFEFADVDDVCDAWDHFIASSQHKPSVLLFSSRF